MSTPKKQMTRLKILQKVMRSLRIRKALKGTSRGAMKEMMTEVE